MPNAEQGTHERPVMDMDTLTDQRMTDTSYQVFRFMTGNCKIVGSEGFRV